MLEKINRIFSKFNDFQQTYKAVRRWQSVISHVAELLEPSLDQTSESVRFRMEHLLNWMQHHYTEPGDEVLVNNVLAYTIGFWNGLFTCYDAPYVPRTNNDHERFFRQTKTKHRRMTGRRSWNDYILRSGEFVVFVDDALRQPHLIERLQKVDYDTFNKERNRWNDRLLEGTKRRRFRKDPESYLNNIENKVSELIGQS
nr:transposase [Paenibacillus periandrae]